VSFSWVVRGFVRFIRFAGVLVKDGSSIDVNVLLLLVLLVLLRLRSFPSELIDLFLGLLVTVCHS
jgi:hypothetical protein